MRAANMSQWPRGIVVLYSAPEEPVDATRSDVLADLETTFTATSVARALRERAPAEVHLVPAAHCIEAKLSPFPPDEYWVFNLFEGLDEPQADSGTLDDEARAARVLQEMGYRFTGAGCHSLSLAVNKALTKERLRQVGVSTPAWRVLRSEAEVSETNLSGLTFPLIAKPVAEDSSLGIGLGAVAADLHRLRDQVAHIVSDYGQHALVEEFIDGREINVGLWGDPPEVLPIAEIDLSAFSDPLQRIVGFSAKWVEDSFEYNHTPAICPACLEPALKTHIQDVARRSWQACEGAGYGRVDMRVRGERAYVLEVNPNPSLAPDAGFARMARAAGYDYADMALQILSFIGED